MTSSCSNTSTLAQLQRVFPGVIQVDTRALASVLGIAIKTINNAGDDFHIRSVRFGRRKYFRLVDIACFMDSSLGIAEQAIVVSDENPPLNRQKRGPGRPRKGATA